MKLSNPKVMILFGGCVGDCIAITPSLKAIRRTYPDARVTVIGHPYSAAIFQNSPDVDRLIVPDPDRTPAVRYVTELLRLRRERFDLLLDFQSNTHTCFETLMIGGRKRLGYDSRRTRSPIYTDRVPYRRDIHAVLRYASLLEPAGLALQEEDKVPRLDLTAGERQDAQQILLDAGLSPGQRYVLLQATIGRDARGYHREWPMEKFASLAGRIQDELGLAVVVSSKSADEVPIRRLQELVQHPLISVAGKTTLRTMAAVVEKAQLYVGYNSGPMHMAAALNTPIVAFMDLPHERITWRPWTEAPCRLLEPGPFCENCSRPECNPDRGWCLRTMEVDRVLDGVKGMLSM